MNEINHKSTQSAFSSPRPVNIYDVAKRANVSTKTVSKVMNNRPQVSRATRKRVMEAVEELGYRPNPLARGLACDHSFMLGVMCNAPAVGSGYIARVQMGVLSFCQKEGYHMVVECLQSDNPELHRTVQELAVRSRLAAIILTPPLTDHLKLIAALQENETPILRLSPETNIPGCMDVDVDNRRAAREMAAYLISLGHRRIGFVKGAQDHADARARYAGFRDALAEAGIPFDETLCEDGNYTYKSGMDAGDRLLALDNRPTAIFASNDDMAAGVMAASLKFGLNVPRDLSVAGFDDALFAQAVWPRLTTCRQPIAEMVEEGVSLLFKQQAGGSSLTGICAKHTIVVRGTTAPPSAS